MALHLNAIESLLTRSTQGRMGAPKSRFREQVYDQPLLIPDTPDDLVEATFLIEQKRGAVAQSAPWTGESLSALPPQDEWGGVLFSIDRLMTPSEDHDVIATEYAYRSARSVVEAAYGLLTNGKKHLIQRVPSPVAVTDERGSVKLAWSHGDKHVRVTFGASPGLRSYLYFESPESHDVEDLQPSNLQQRLDWLLAL